MRDIKQSLKFHFVLTGPCQRKRDAAFSSEEQEEVVKNRSALCTLISRAHKKVIYAAESNTARARQYGHPIVSDHFQI